MHKGLENVLGVGAGSRGSGLCEAAWRGGLVLGDDAGWAVGSRLASLDCGVWAWDVGSKGIGPDHLGLSQKGQIQIKMKVK